MSKEETLVAQCKQAFPELGEDIRVQRERRLFLTIAYPSFPAVLDFAVTTLEFSALCAITGLDEGEQLGVIYHLARRDGVMLNIHTMVPRAEPVLQSIHDRFPAAELYERELVDLLGFQVQSLPPEANRYPLRDDWPAGQYPLRKDWDPAILDQVYKGGCDK